MECSLDVEILSNISDATIEVSEYINIEVTEDGWDVQATDDSRLALFSFSLGKDSFETLRVARQTTMCIESSALQTVIKTMAPAKLVRIQLIDKALNIEGNCKGKNILCELKILEHRSDQLRIPEMDFECVVNLSSVEFVKACKINVEETLHIQAGSDIVFTSKGKVCDSHIQYTDAVMKESSEFTLEFASKHLSLFARGILMSKMVVLGMSPGSPIRIEFSVVGGHMCYFLSPVN